MRLITIQNYKVAEYLRHHSKFVVPDDVHWSDNLIAPYKFMMKHYNYDHRPIFYGAVGHNANLGGAKTEDSVILELDVPDIYCKIQDYYNWSDFIYFTELPQDFEPWNGIETVEQFGKWTLDLYKNGFTGRSNTCYQVTTCFMMKSWVKNIVKMTSEFDTMFIDNGGNKVLHSTLYGGN